MEIFSILIESLYLNKKYLIKILNQIIIAYLFLKTGKEVVHDLMLCVIKITVLNWKYNIFTFEAHYSNRLHKD